MARGKNERTSAKVAKVAAKVLRTGKATPKEAKTLAGSVLTQAPGQAEAEEEVVIRLHATTSSRRVTRSTARAGMVIIPLPWSGTPGSCGDIIGAGAPNHRGMVHRATYPTCRAGNRDELGVDRRLAHRVGYCSVPRDRGWCCPTMKSATEVCAARTPGVGCTGGCGRHSPSGLCTASASGGDRAADPFELP